MRVNLADVSRAEPVVSGEGLARRARVVEVRNGVRGTAEEERGISTRKRGRIRGERKRTE